MRPTGGLGKHHRRAARRVAEIDLWSALGQLEPLRQSARGGYRTQTWNRDHEESQTDQVSGTWTTAHPQPGQQPWSPERQTGLHLSPWLGTDSSVVVALLVGRRPALFLVSCAQPRAKSAVGWLPGEQRQHRPQEPPLVFGLLTSFHVPLLTSPSKSSEPVSQSLVSATFTILTSFTGGSLPCIAHASFSTW